LEFTRLTAAIYLFDRLPARLPAVCHTMLEP